MPIRPIFSATRDGAIQFAVRVSPRASRRAIEGIVRDADGGKMLKVAVNAPPEDGKANQEVLALLARAMGVPKGRLSLAAGASGRKKIVRLEDADAVLLMRLNEWTNTLESLS